MKKLIGTVAVAAMIATAAFAEISFGAWLRAIWAPVAYDGEDVKAGLTNSWGWGARPARLNVNASTEDGRAGMSMGIYNDANGNLSSGDDMYLFVKPWEPVKLTLGSADYNLFRGDLCYGSWNWIRPDIVGEDEGLTFESHGKQVKGALIEIAPVEGLVMAWGLPVLDGDNYWRDAGDMLKSSEAAVMYTIADIAKIKVGFKGKNGKAYSQEAEDGYTFYTDGTMKFKTNGTYRTFDKKTNTFVDADKDGKATTDAEKAKDKTYGKATEGELMKWDTIEDYNAWWAKYTAAVALQADPKVATYYDAFIIEYNKEKPDWKKFKEDYDITTDAQKLQFDDVQAAYEWALAEGIIDAEGNDVTAAMNMDGRADPEWDRYWSKKYPENMVAPRLYQVDVDAVPGGGDMYKYIGDLSIGFDLIAVENMFLTVGAKIGLAQSGYKDITPIDVARIALGFSYQILDNLKLSLSGAFTINSADDANSFWVGLGLDVGLTDSLALAADFRFKKADLGGDSDPMMCFLVGVNYACSSNGSVGIGFQGVINQGFVSGSSSGLPHAGDGKFGFAIPITASVWF